MFKRINVRGMVLLFVVAIVMMGGNITSGYGADEATIQKLKEKLALANMILEYEKMATPFGHVSARIPGTETFLIAGGAVAPGMVTMEDMVVCDMDGKVLQGKHKRTYSEVVIHTEAYKKRKDMNSVVHTHTPYVIALSLLDHTVVPADLSSLSLGPEPIALYKKMVFIDIPDFAAEVSDLFGPNKAVILRGHGAVVVGKSIEDAMFTAKILENSAMLQFMVRSAGKLAPLTEQEKAPVIEFIKKMDQSGIGGQREWGYYEFKLRK